MNQAFSNRDFEGRTAQITRESVDSSAVNGGHLKAFIERVEHLHEEKRAIEGDISEVFKEAKGVGFDVKIMKKIVALRRMDREKRIEEAEIMSLYMSAIGMEE